MLECDISSPARLFDFLMIFVLYSIHSVLLPIQKAVLVVFCFQVSCQVRVKKNIVFWLEFFVFAFVI